MKLLLSIIVASIVLIGCSDSDDLVPSTGVSCEMATDCEGGVCLDYVEQIDTTFVGGYCTNDCSQQWDCHLGNVCILVESYDDSGFCFQICEEDNECRTGEDYGCIQLGLFDSALQICVPETLRRDWDTLSRLVPISEATEPSPRSSD
jgi:hypothetical protein